MNERQKQEFTQTASIMRILRLCQMAHLDMDHAATLLDDAVRAASVTRVMRVIADLEIDCEYYVGVDKAAFTMMIGLLRTYLI